MRILPISPPVWKNSIIKEKIPLVKLANFDALPPLFIHYVLSNLVIRIALGATLAPKEQQN